MTVYCQRCDAKFNALMGEDVAAERQMYLDHLKSFHNVEDPVLHSFFRWEIDRGVDKEWGYGKGKAGYELG